MKMSQILFTFILTITVALMVTGKDIGIDSSSAAMKKHRAEHMNMMGKPTFDTTVSGLHLKMWIITQKQHKKLMKGKVGKAMMKNAEDGKTMDAASKEAMMAGTHHCMLTVHDIDTGKEITTAETKIRIDVPSKKEATLIDLKPMMGHYGESITLNEKGKNVITISVTVDGFTRNATVKYMFK